MRKPYQAKTVAKFLIEAAEVAEPTICMTNSKLNSMLYYVQAWYMIKYGTPCFTDQLYAQLGRSCRRSALHFPYIWRLLLVGHYGKANKDR